MNEKERKMPPMPEDLVPLIQEIIKIEKTLKLEGKLMPIAAAFREIVDPAFDYKYTPTSIEEFNQRFSTPVAEASPYQPPASDIARDKTAYLVDFNYDFTNFDGDYSEIRLRIFSNLTAKVEVLTNKEKRDTPSILVRLPNEQKEPLLNGDSIEIIQEFNGIILSEGQLVKAYFNDGTEIVVVVVNRRENFPVPRSMQYIIKRVRGYKEIIK